MTVLSAPKIQRYVLRPLLWVWIVMSIAVGALVIADCCLPPGLSPIGRLVEFRQNIGCPEWTAAEAAKSQVPCDCVVIVDTDDTSFFYLLRYKLYPTWVLAQSDLPAWDVASLGIPQWSIDYHDGVVLVSGSEAD